MTLESERQHDDMSRRKQTSIKREWGKREGRNGLLFTRFDCQ